MMTSSDRALDRALGDLPLLTPLRSEWRTVDRHLEWLERMARRKQVIHKTLVATAAALCLAVTAVLAVNIGAGSPADLQRTVDAAIADARPGLMSSELRFSGAKLPLEALLVSAQPRSGLAIKSLGASESGEHSDSRKPGSEAESHPKDF